MSKAQEIFEKLALSSKLLQNASEVAFKKAKGLGKELVDRNSYKLMSRKATQALTFSNEAIKRKFVDIENKINKLL